MDEAGQPGNTGPAEAGPGAESRDPSRRLNGWATADRSWSPPAAPVGTNGSVPSWRDSGTSTGSGAWPDPPRSPSRHRFADLLAQLDPDEPTAPGLTGRPVSGPPTPPADPAPYGHVPASAPPYPYEGDLDAGPPFGAGLGTGPAAGVGRPAEGARHALGDPPADRRPVSVDGDPDPSGYSRRWPYEPPAPAGYEPPAPAGYEPPGPAGYEPPGPAGYGLPDRSGYDPAAADLPTGYAPSAAYADPAPRQADTPVERTPEALPQRVPARPDVPTVPEPPSVEPSAPTPELARIATHLRRDDLVAPQERPDGFDVNAILAAVREVDGVRDASVRTTPEGAHSLRLDLADGADAADVSRIVARLLSERMGLDAAMPDERYAPYPPEPTPYVPTQATAAAREPLGGRAPVSGRPDTALGRAAPPPGLRPSEPSLTPPDLTATRPPEAPTRPPGASTRPPEVATRPSEPETAEPVEEPAAAASGDVGPPAGRRADLREPADPSASGGREHARHADEAEPTGPYTGDVLGGGTPGVQWSVPHGREPVTERPPRDPAGGELPSRAATRARAADLPRRTDVLPTAGGYPDGAERPGGEPPRPIIPGDRPGPRVVIENVQVNTYGIEATVEVRLVMGAHVAAGVAVGPAVDGYLLRLCAMATASAVDQLLALSDHAEGPARCFVEHAAAVPFGPCEVAVVVVLLSCGGWVEQLAGSAVVTSDHRHAVVRATLAAVNRRLEALLS